MTLQKSIPMIMFRGASRRLQRLRLPPPAFDATGNSSLAAAAALPRAPYLGFEQKRNSSSSAARDSRIAGRRRFYKTVDITSTPPPWDSQPPSGKETIQSPISPGVDGTASAAGVSNKKPSQNNLTRMLNPYNPTTGEEWYGITLDGRLLRTPLGQSLALPSQTLALAVASEWDAQNPTLSPPQMPLTTLSCTALDQTCSEPTIAIQNCLRYLPTDTSCYFADPTEDRVMNRRQMRAWEKLHDWTQEKFGDRPSLAVGNGEALVISRVRKSKGTVGLPHPDILSENIEEYLNQMNAWELTALQSVTMEAKSLLVALALIDLDNDKFSASWAVDASRVEEEFQIENWGMVEGQHDYDRLNCSIQVTAASVLVRSIAMDGVMRD